MPRFVPTEELFKGRHFDQETVAPCVRWYLSFKLSFRNLVAMIGERGILGLGGHPKPAIRVTRSPGTRSNHAQLFQRGDRLLDPVHGYCQVPLQGLHGTLGSTRSERWAGG